MVWTREPMACRELVNWRPRSGTMSAGILKRQTQCERKALVTVLASMETRGTASSQRVSLSQMVSR